jgi:hypothetical protein
MQKFSFYMDEKVTSWHRKQFRVEANSFDEAVAKIQELMNNPDIPKNNIEYSGCSQEIEETTEVLLPEDNHGESTCKIYGQGGRVLIYENGVSE